MPRNLKTLIEVNVEYLGQRYYFIGGELTGFLSCS